VLGLGWFPMPPVKSVSLIVSGGQASPGPPLGPSLGPLGVNIGAVVNEINRLTKDFLGMKVPVTVTVDQGTKEFKVEVGIPTAAALIVKEAGAQKGSGKPGTESVGSLSMEQVVRIARMKMGGTYASSLRGAVNLVLGTCVSLGVTVEGQHPREARKRVDAGEYEEALKE